MRADRLLSIMMLLQSHGKMSAPQLAKELEVSVRSIYRDIEALSAAGVPVYTERGIQGGCVLSEGYRSNLTGLTNDEIKALFILGNPASLDELGMGQDFKSALRKLSASLPDAQMQFKQTTQQRIYIDWSTRNTNSNTKPCLQNIFQAISDNYEISISYFEMIGPLTVRFERTVKPYGLVAKDTEWHLICADNNRLYVYRVSRILSAKKTGKLFEYPRDFNLKSFWESWYTKSNNQLPAYPVKVRISPNLAKYVSAGYEEQLYDGIRRDKHIEADGSIITTLIFENIPEARSFILKFGSALEIIEPVPLRLSVIDHARQILKIYQ